MPTKPLTRDQINAVLDARDREATKVGQDAAKRYLRAKAAQSPTTLWVREAAHLAVLILVMATLFVIAFAL